MSRLIATARFALAEFGPLIVFWTLAAPGRVGDDK